MMIRNLKALGLALVAVFALSAIAVASASAHEFKSEKESGTVYLTATSEEGTKDTFTVSSILGSQTVKCHGAFSGSGAAPEADTLTINATYTNCEFAGEPAGVSMNGCDYVFGSDTDENGHANVDVNCPGTDTSEMIAITNSLCDMYVGSQNTGEGVHYTNLGDGTVTVTSTVKVAIAEKVKTSTCFSLGNTGKYTSTAIVTGYNDAEHTEPIGIEVS